MVQCICRLFSNNEYVRLRKLNYLEKEYVNGKITKREGNVT